MSEENRVKTEDELKGERIHPGRANLKPFSRDDHERAVA